MKRLLSISLLVLSTAILLTACAPGVLIQTKDRTDFHPMIEQKFEARSEPAKLANDDESTLTRKGYVKIGTISAWHQGRDNRSEAMKMLEAAILKKAAEVAGDAVHLDREAVPGTAQVETGKVKKFCLDEETTQGGDSLSINTRANCQRISLRKGSAEVEFCNTVYSYKPTYITKCLKWGERKEIVHAKGLISEGTVWRHDPKLSAKIMSAQGAKGKTTVYVYRRWSILGAALKRLIYCDNVELALVQNGRYFRVQLEPTTHVFRTELADSDIVINGRPGGVYYIEVGLIEGGFAYLTLTKHPRGILGLKSLDSDEIIDRTRVAAKGEIPDGPMPKDLGLWAPCWFAGKGLIDAASDGDLSGVNSLIAAKADVNAKDEDGFTPLMTASRRGHVEMTRALLEAKADVNAKNVDGVTSLMYASLGDRIEVVRALLEAKADVDTKDKNGWTALMYASKREAKMHVVGKKKKRRTARKSVPRRNVEVVQALLDAKANVNAKNVDGATPLMYASLGDSIEVVQALLQAKADVNARNVDGATPLMYASLHDNDEVVRLLLEAKADVNARKKSGFTPLMYASQGGNEEVVVLLLEANADVNAKDKDGYTSLMAASGFGDEEVVRLLLDAKADVDAKNKDGFTPLMYASLGDNVEVVRTLLQAAADVNLRSENGLTPLMAASHHGNVEVVRGLLDAKADVNAKDKYGFTPLMTASRLGHVKVVRALLEAKADVNAKALLDITALWLASNNGRNEVVKLLTQAGAISSIGED